MYPEFTPDPGKPFREQLRNWAKRSQTVFRRSWVLKKITRNDPVLGTGRSAYWWGSTPWHWSWVRKPKTLSEIVKISGLEKKNVEHFWKKCHAKGLLEYNWENAAHEKQYVLPMYVPGCAEFFNMNAKYWNPTRKWVHFFWTYVPFATGEKITHLYRRAVPESACMSSRWKSNRDGKWICWSGTYFLLA